jgi:hypothetical protein
MPIDISHALPARYATLGDDARPAEMMRDVCRLDHRPMRTRTPCGPSVFASAIFLRSIQHYIEGGNAGAGNAAIHFIRDVVDHVANAVAMAGQRPSTPAKQLGPAGSAAGTVGPARSPGPASATGPTIATVADECGAAAITALTAGPARDVVKASHSPRGCPSRAICRSFWCSRWPLVSPAQSVS